MADDVKDSGAAAAPSDGKGAGIRPATALAAAQTVIVGILGALQITNDLVSRMARNHPWATGIAFGCVALAYSMALVMALVREPAGAPTPVPVEEDASKGRASGEVISGPPPSNPANRPQGDSGSGASQGAPASRSQRHRALAGFVAGCVGIAAVLTGSVAAAVGAIFTHKDDDTPIVSASISASNPSQLDVRVRAGPLESDEFVRLEVVGVRLGPSSDLAGGDKPKGGSADNEEPEREPRSGDEPNSWWTRNTKPERESPPARAVYLSSGGDLYQANIGAGLDGKVDETVKVPLPEATAGGVSVRAWIGGREANSCLYRDDEEERTGCVILALGRTLRAPKLDAKVVRESDGNVVVISAVDAGSVKSPLWIRVRQTRPAPRQLLGSWRLAAGVDGGLDFSNRLRLPAATREICVVASRQWAISRCRDGPYRSYARLRVPRREATAP